MTNKPVRLVDKNKPLATPRVRSMPLTLSGTDSFSTTDNENFQQAGSTPSQINHLVWQGLPGVYLAATNNGLMKTVDGGLTWDYLRPNATFGGDWPAGSVGRQVAFAIGPRCCKENDVFDFGSGSLYAWFLNDDQDNSILMRYSGGGSWQSLGSVSGFLIEPNFSVEMSGLNSDIVANGVDFDTDKLYVSNNGGSSFSTVTVPGGGVSNYIAVDAGGRFWLTTTTGQLWFSEDKGQTWSDNRDPTGATASGAGFIVPHPTKSDVIAMGWSDLILRVAISQDAGQSWEVTEIDDATGENVVSPGIRPYGVWTNYSPDCNGPVDRFSAIYLKAQGTYPTWISALRTSYSDDYGNTWSSVEDIHTWSGAVGSGPVVYRAAVTANGVHIWVAPGYFNAYTDEGIMFRSKLGENWEELANPGAGSDSSIRAERGAILDDGSFVVAYRTGPSLYDVTLYKLLNAVKVGPGEETWEVIPMPFGTGVRWLDTFTRIAYQ